MYLVINLFYRDKINSSFIERKWSSNNHTGEQFTVI
uniref:Uncharacterized protein n=1 Tax=Arundo donax TaxID=35708 RepID=A0A0A9BN75_ARUDO